jgi:hypothetical protein
MILRLRFAELTTVATACGVAGYLWTTFPVSCTYVHCTRKKNKLTDCIVIIVILNEIQNKESK